MRTEGKYTPDQLARGIAEGMLPHLRRLIRLAIAGQPLQPALTDLKERLEYVLPQQVSRALVSPYCDVSDDAWLEAYETACIEIYEREDREREPSREEVDHALECIRERSNGRAS
jgi:hypothetical protein